MKKGQLLAIIQIMVRPVLLTPARLDAIVDAVTKFGRGLKLMAAAGGCSPDTVSRHLSTNQDFADRVARAEGSYARRLLRSAQERALKGVTNRHGEQVYSDALLIRLLKRSDPDGFGDRVRVEQNTTVVRGVDWGSVPEEVRRHLVEAAKAARAKRANDAATAPAPALAAPADPEGPPGGEEEPTPLALLGGAPEGDGGGGAEEAEDPPEED